jgi:rubredoxin
VSDEEDLDLRPASKVFITDEGTPGCDILVDYYTDVETPELEEGDKLIHEKQLPPKFECGFCNHVFRSRLETPRCPHCGQANWQCYRDSSKVMKLEKDRGENPQ